MPPEAALALFPRIGAFGKAFLSPVQGFALKSLGGKKSVAGTPIFAQNKVEDFPCQRGGERGKNRGEKVDFWSKSAT